LKRVTENNGPEDLAAHDLIALGARPAITVGW